MNTYLEVTFFRDEYGDDDFPQLLCNYIVDKYFPGYEGQKILDIGSGRGFHLGAFARCGMKAYGLDKSNVALSQPNVRYCDIESDLFPYDDNFFDFIFSKSVLEHVANTDNFLSESLRTLKPGGFAVFMTPDWKSAYKFFWDDYTHIKPFTRRSLQNAMIVNKFHSVRCSRLVQLPIVWKYPWVEYLTKIIALLPNSLRWKDAEERESRRLVRFSKEKMLLAIGQKVEE